MKPNYLDPTILDPQLYVDPSHSPVELDLDNRSSTLLGSSASRSSGDVQSTNTLPDWYSLFASLPKLEDFNNLIDEVKQTLQTELFDLRQSLTSLKTRVQTSEIQHTETSQNVAMQQQSSHIIDMQHQLENIENRQHRNNIRVMGIEWVKGQEDDALFNLILGHPSSKPIAIDRSHRDFHLYPPLLPFQEI
ncbi:Hypothetical predicted protein [Pelobates cultripes]|uniref:Uncharacterized protein n=1 Tax=Pelobates cultripes TaxID=61616 RepID=A0AAD1RU04_PELCU|nr:Hypothetical predicted protein [Pelobates cultripes]